jgi:hypothetical protein
LQAGNELAAYLEKRHAEHPTARLMILAHSHGGTVSLYAMQKLSEEDCVSDLIFMNTPFLECQKRPLDKFGLVIIPSLAGAFFLCALLTLNSPRSGYYLATMVTMFFLAMTVYTVAKKRFPLIQEFLYQRINVRSPSARLINITCDDEVGYWLGLVHYLANIPFRVWFFVTRWGFRLFIIFFAVSMLSGLASIPIMLSHHNRVDTKSFAGAVVVVLWLVFSYIGAGIPIFAGITGGFAILFLSVLVLAPRTIHGNRFAFGDDLEQNLLLDISAHKEPSTQERQDYSSWKYTGAALGQRHFAYRFPPAVDYVRKILTNPAPWERIRNVDRNTEPLAAPKPPAKLTWRSVLADLKPAQSARIDVPQQSRAKRIAARIFVCFVCVCFTLAIASQINGWVSSREETRVLKSNGFPTNATYQSEIALGPATLKQLANVLSGYQSYLESTGHPATWRQIQISVKRSLDEDEPGAPPPREALDLSATPPVLTLNGSFFPDRGELVERYSELLLSVSDGFSDSSVDHTGQAIAEGVTQYFCLGYVGSPCTTMTPHATWPQQVVGLSGTFLGGYALAEALARFALTRARNKQIEL